MIAIRYEQNGPATEVLTPTQTDAPEPGAGEVRLRLIASPIHNHDLITVAGGYGKTPGLPATAGSEALGVVDKLGAGVTVLAEGERVIAAGLSGAWADSIIAPAERLVAVPEGMSDDLAAQIAGMPVDALIAFTKLGAEPGDWLIVNAANGAVGKAVMQIARDRGVHVAGLVHRDGAKADLEAQGFADIFVTSDEGWPEALHQRIGDARVAGGIEMVGGALADQMIALMSPDATLLVMGAMSGEPMQIGAGPVIFGEQTIKGFWGGREASRMRPDQIRAVVQEVIELGQQGRFDLPVAEHFPLSRIAEAAAASAGPRNGKVLLQPDAA